MYYGQLENRELEDIVYVNTYCVPIAHLRQNKPFRLLYLGHAQIKMAPYLIALALRLLFFSCFAGLSPIFSFFLSLALYSKFVVMTINLSLIL